MNNRQAAEVVGSRERGGSGYLIGRNLILTAHHNISPEGKKADREKFYKVRLFGDYKRNRKEWEDALCVWDEPSLDCDLALLRIVNYRSDFSDLLEGSIVRIGKLFGEKHDVLGYGFPEYKKVGNSFDIELLRGELSGPEFTKDKLLPLQLKSIFPESVKTWVGVSGTNLFTGDALVGVIVEANKYGDMQISRQVLSVSPLAAMASDREFCQVFSELGIQLEFVNLSSPDIRQAVTATESKPPTSNPRRTLYENRLKAKQEELDAITDQIDEELSADSELKLGRRSERLLSDIEDLEAKLADL